MQLLTLIFVVGFAIGGPRVLGLLGRGSSIWEAAMWGAVFGAAGGLVGALIAKLAGKKE